MERLTRAIKDARLRTGTMYVIVLALGVLFSVLILVSSQKVLDTSRRLVGSELPLLDRVTALKVEIARQEALLHDYHAIGDKERFEPDYAQSARVAQRLLEELTRDYGTDEPIPSIRALLARLEGMARRLAPVFTLYPENGQDTGPDMARVRELVRELHAELDVLAGLVEARAFASARVAQDEVRHMAQLAILFSMAVFLIAVVVGYYINLYMRGNIERRRLAVFAERNPNPVMRLSLAGEVIYANAAAAEAARQLDAVSPRTLLPPDLGRQLEQLRTGGERYAVSQYEHSGRSFECGIHYLPDLAIFHVYVADVTERRLSEERLVFQAYHHPLTRLPNRRMFEEVIEKTLSSAQDDMRAAVLVIGVDRLNVVYDTLGHLIGDQVLREVGARLAGTLENCRDLSRQAALYHFDGDTFCVFVPGVANAQLPVQLAERLIASSAQSLYVAGREFFASVSIGVALFPDDGADATTLIKNAASAMQEVRAQGGPGFRLYKPEMNAMATHWLALESYLRHAIERDELRLHYQPQVDLRSGRVEALEALLRWEHPERGMLTPAEFIRLAEDSGMILTIGDWVLRTACAQARAWRERGVTNAVVAVNISGRQFHRQNLPALIGSVLAEARLAPEALELEITESVAMQDMERTVDMLHELKDMGIRLAMDDFGTGFSSLAYLKRFPLDKLKIDQSFVRYITADGPDAAIVRAVVTLGHALGLRVGAEGVERPEQLARLRQYECDEAQGGLYSLPLAAHRLELYLRGSERRGAPAQV